VGPASGGTARYETVASCPHKADGDAAAEVRPDHLSDGGRPHWRPYSRGALRALGRVDEGGAARASEDRSLIAYGGFVLLAEDFPRVRGGAVGFPPLILARGGLPARARRRPRRSRRAGIQGGSSRARAEAPLMHDPQIISLGGLPARAEVFLFKGFLSDLPARARWCPCQRLRR
jgi:hypothetical protein